MNPTLPSSSTKRLPECTSAWNQGMFITLDVQVFNAVMMRVSGSFVIVEMLSASTIETPLNLSMVKTLLVVKLS